MGQSVQRVVGFTSRSDVTAKSVGGVGTLDGSAFFVNVGDVDLHGGVVLSLDDSVSGGALSGDVKFDLLC